jgi:hypothetical protein
MLKTLVVAGVLVAGLSGAAMAQVYCPAGYAYSQGRCYWVGTPAGVVGGAVGTAGAVAGTAVGTAGYVAGSAVNAATGIATGTIGILTGH